MNEETRAKWANLLGYKELTDDHLTEANVIYQEHQGDIEDRDFWKDKYNTLKEVYQKSLSNSTESDFDKLSVPEQITILSSQLTEVRKRL